MVHIYFYEYETGRIGIAEHEGRITNLYFSIKIGSPKAARAVGLANNRNPIPIIIPCHRVIGLDGSLTGYRGGLDFKKKLLDMENKK